MSLHFLPRTRVRTVNLDTMPGCICLVPGVLLCHQGDWIDVEELGRFRALKVEWKGENADEACTTVEVIGRK